MVESTPLDVPCPTCKAGLGEPCAKRSNLARGGPHHLTRVDRHARKERRERHARPGW